MWKEMFFLYYIKLATKKIYLIKLVKMFLCILSLLIAFLVAIIVGTILSEAIYPMEEISKIVF
jgi:hypothetical protein